MNSRRPVNSDVRPLDFLFQGEIDMSTETLAILGLIIAACAVFYQARAYHLSRRDLSLKVKDLSELVHRLESESTQRQELDRKHKALQIDSLTQHAAALDHASQLGGIHTESSGHLSRHVYSAITDIQHVLLAHNAIVGRNSDRLDSSELKLLAAASAFCKATLAQIALADAWARELLEMQASNASGKPDTVAAAKERVRVITETTARLAGKYSDAIDTLNREVIAARSRFVELLSPYIVD
jgi:hypothetical protein